MNMCVTKSKHGVNWICSQKSSKKNKLVRVFYFGSNLDRSARVRGKDRGASVQPYFSIVFIVAKIVVKGIMKK